MKPASVLRWYPKAWRERYGEELLALIQDTLAEGRPGWRLRLGVVRGGLHERARQSGRVVKAAVKRGPGRWGTMLVAGLILTDLPENLAQSPPQARGWQATAALDAVLASVALTGAVVLACGLAALPALVRFLRAGGWQKIRRRVAWAAGATEAPHARVPGASRPAGAGRGNPDHGHGHARGRELLVVGDSVTWVAGRGPGHASAGERGRIAANTAGGPPGQATAGR